MGGHRKRAGYRLILASLSGGRWLPNRELWGTLWLLSSIPDPFPDLLQCLNVSIVSSAACRAVFPGRITDNMVCASGTEGADACQVSGRSQCLVTQAGSRRQSREDEGERDVVRKKGRRRIRQGDPGDGRRAERRRGGREGENREGKMGGAQERKRKRRREDGGR